MDRNSNRFRDKLEDSDEFVLTCELVPGKTAKGRPVKRVIEFAQRAAEHGEVDCLSITDNPGGNPSLSPDQLARQIGDMGIATLVHFTCRDANRLGVFSRLEQLDQLGIRNVLALTGDFPSRKDPGTAKPCYDMDAVTLLCLIRSLNTGIRGGCTPLAIPQSGQTDLYPGAAVACQMSSEAEQINQHLKLAKKIRNGARFIMTQISYDARKLDELIKVVHALPQPVPVLATVHVLTEPVARFMNQRNVPGVFIADRLYQQVKEEAASDDKGRAASLQRTAELMAILKGLGFRGAHISGSHDYDEIREILDRFDQVQNDWPSLVPHFDFPFDDGFYAFEKDISTGLNSPQPGPVSSDSLMARIPMALSGLFHKAAFDRQSPLYPGLKAWAKVVDRRPTLSALYRAGEDMSKKILFDCRRCGDCALADMAYRCPESGCPKYLRNGPCGGSIGKRCEVHSDRDCVWISVYERLKSVGREHEIGSRCVPPRNWLLDQTSSWLNFYLGRDHHAVMAKECPHAECMMELDT